MNNATENLELIKEFGTSGLENMRALGELNQRTWEKMAEQQMNTFGLILDAGLQQLNLATRTKDVSELINGQAKLTHELRDNLLAKSRESIELSTEIGTEYRTWMEQGANTFTSKMSKAADKAA